MISKLIVTLSSLAAVDALGSWQLTEPLGYEWYSNNTKNFTSTWSKPFNITKHWLTGASSGGVLAANMLRTVPEGVDGFGLIIGFFKTQGWIDPDQQNWFFKDPEFNFTLKNLTDVPVYMIKGSLDQFTDNPGYFKNVDHIKKSGANVSAAFIKDFQHMLATNMPVDEVWNKEASCAIIPNIMPGQKPNYPYESGVKNCGYNTVYYMLEHFYGQEGSIDELVERDFNHTKYGNLHAFNQTVFAKDYPGANLDDFGYIYIPHACKEGAYCKSLFFFHGCLSGAAWWKETELRRSGIIEYAATNNIIAVFPQSVDSMKFKMMGHDFEMPLCWSAGTINEDGSHPQIQVMQDMYHSLVLGNEDEELASMSALEIQAFAMGKKDALNQQKVIEQLDLQDDIMLV